MLGKLDKYILRKFLTAFFFTAFLVTLTAIVIHFAENINKFISQSIGVSEVIIGFYIPYIPWINGLLWPLYALISVIFVNSRMASNNEILAILNAGVSYHRFLVPTILGSVIISAMMYFGINQLIPNSNRLKNDFENEKNIKKREHTKSLNTHFFIGDGSKIYARYYRKKDSLIQTFRLETFSDDGKLKKLIKAKNVRFKSEPHLWTLENYSIRTFNGIKESLIISEGEDLDTILNFSPGDFILHSKQMEIMTSDDLRKYIKREEERGLDSTNKYYIELHRRWADPFTIIILALIGVSVASRKVRGGTGIQLAIGIVIASAFVLLSKFTVTFAHNTTISPALGVWIPNILFGFVALFLIYKAQK